MRLLEMVLAPVATTCPVPCVRTVRGFVAVTDLGWYEHLSREPGPKDANFWRPSTRRARFAPGTPFLFKLKAPHHAMAGFGYFASFSVLPDWLAWERPTTSAP